MTTLLIVDDDESLGDGLRRALKLARPTWQTYVANSGKDALALLPDKSIDVLVTDMDMPGMSGANLLEKISDHSPNVLRIVISGRYDGLTTYAMTARSHLFLAKPFHPSQIVDLVENSLEGQRRQLEIRRLRGRQLPREEQARINRQRLRDIGIRIDD